ncbi:hypothetical protein [Actinocrispum wychmicini]|uniref:Uncharacterized protein n=1 Tax=Actinocrispum wychmicini TaxID=1213861 RepID=A0A4R2IWN7_9PSEU|nr:hypothetical protein [Actinocrispum wychmicini]TCO48806.1 hypothetical protein EV192_11527 [Actinocrispum wychmicini]
MSAEDLLKTLLTDHLPDPPAALAAPTPRRRRTRPVVPIASAAVAVIAVGAVIAIGTTRNGGVGVATAPNTPSSIAPVAGKFWSWGEGQIDRDGTVTVDFRHGTCDGPWHLRVIERDQVVILGLEDIGTQDPHQGCALVSVLGQATARLTESQRGKPVFDAADGKPHQLFDVSKVLKPGYLPVPDKPFFQGVWDVNSPQPGAWVRMYNTELDGGYALNIVQGTMPYRDGERVRDVSVRGGPGTVYLSSIPPKIDPQTGQPYTDPRTGKPYEPMRTISVVWQEGEWWFTVSIRPADGTPNDQEALISEALKVAEGLHK